MSSKGFSMLHRRFACARLSDSYLTCSKTRLLTITFTTAVFGRSSLWQFEADPYRPTPKGLPSSLVQHDALACSCHNHPAPLPAPDVILSHRPALLLPRRLPPSAGPSDCSRYDPGG